MHDLNSFAEIIREEIITLQLRVNHLFSEEDKKRPEIDKVIVSLYQARNALEKEMFATK